MARKKKTSEHFDEIDLEDYGTEMKIVALQEFLQFRAVRPSLKLADYLKGFKNRLICCSGDTVDETINNYFDQLPGEVMVTLAEQEGWSAADQLELLTLFMDNVKAGSKTLAEYLNELVNPEEVPPTTEPAAAVVAEVAVVEDDAEPTVSSTPFEQPEDDEPKHEQVVEVTTPLTNTLLNYLSKEVPHDNSEPEAVLHSFQAEFGAYTAHIAVQNGEEGPFVDAYIVDKANNVLAECETTKELFQSFVFRGENLPDTYVVRVVTKEAQGPTDRPRSRQEA